ncbi:MAG: OmpA family protein, partial [Pseudomonadota bacterium]
TDEQVLSSGAPDAFSEGGSFALRQLSRFTSGEVSLTDQNLNVSGVAKTANDYRLATAAVSGALPAGLALAASDIKPATIAPYTWRADYNGTKVALSGFVPNDAARTSILDQTKAALPSAQVEDLMQIAAGAGDNFTDQTNEALAQLPRFTNGYVALNDNNLTVEGVASGSDAFSAAQTALGALGSGLVLESSSIVPPNISPYTWSADLAPGAVTLGGFVPSSDARSTILDQTKVALPGVTVNDNMKIAGGAPAGFTDKTAYALAQLPSLVSGQAFLRDSALGVTGKARTPDSFDAVGAALASPPEGLTIGTRDISAPTVSPYAWNADYDGERVALSGFVPSDEQRQAIVGAVGDALPGKAVEDNMRLADGAPEGFGDMAGFAVGLLPKFSNGSVGLSDKALSVRGVAGSSTDFDSASGSAAGTLPEGMTIAENAIVPPSVSPYTWSAKTDGSTVTLGGYVPDQATRSAIVAQATSRAAGASIVDRMQVAAGAPDGFSDLVGGALTVLPRFSEADIALSDRDLSVTGTGRTSGDYMSAERYLKGALAGEPASVTARILPPMVEGDYQWSARKTGTSVILGGMAPTRIARENIADHAKALNPGATVVNRMTIMRGSPNGYLANARRGLSILDSVSSGETSLTGDALSVEGKAKTVLAFEDAQRSLAVDLTEGSWGSRAIEPATVSPYSWAVEKSDTGTTVSGFVPNRGTGNVNVAATRSVISGPVSDEQRIAVGEPENFGNAVATAISGVSQLTKGSAQITDTNLTIQGRAASETEATRIAAELEAAKPENFNLSTRISHPLPKPEPVSPYVWSIQKDTDATIVSGLTPAAGVKSAVANYAQATVGGAITDEQTVAPGSPANFINATRAVTDAVSQLKAGQGRITDTRVFVRGEAADEASADQVRATLKAALPGNYQLTELISFPPPPKEVSKPAAASLPVAFPYVWSVRKEDDATIVGGVAPTEAAKSANIAFAQTTIGGTITDEQTLASGAPENYAAAAQAVTTAVKSLDAGQGRITDTRIFVRGQADSEGAANQIKSELRAALPSNFQLTELIGFPAPPPAPKPVAAVCNVDFAALFAGEKIRFDTARAVIKPESFGLLDRLGEGLTTCAGTRIEIGGHTDSIGRAGYNQRLSEARAQAVLDYFKGRGIATENLVSKGYGETAPIATNANRAGRAQNRRIEFKVLESK